MRNLKYTSIYFFYFISSPPFSPSEEASSCGKSDQEKHVPPIAYIQSSGRIVGGRQERKKRRGGKKVMKLVASTSRPTSLFHFATGLFVVIFRVVVFIIIAAALQFRSRVIRGFSIVFHRRHGCIPPMPPGPFSVSVEELDLILVVGNVGFELSYLQLKPGHLFSFDLQELFDFLESAMVFVYTSKESSEERLVGEGTPAPEEINKQKKKRSVPR